MPLAFFSDTAVSVETVQTARKSLDIINYQEEPVMPLNVALYQ
jgi:hypothetical protein